MILRILAAGIGTIAFSLLFGVPARYYAYCGVIGAIGWTLYSVLIDHCAFGVENATFCSTLLVMLMSRFCAVWKKCPGTVFVVTGIFPLVPGAGIYRTIYYLILNDRAQAAESGFGALRVVLAIVFGIVLVLELPNKIFHPRKIARNGKT